MIAKIYCFLCPLVGKSNSIALVLLVKIDNCSGVVVVMRGFFETENCHFIPDGRYPLFLLHDFINGVDTVDFFFVGKLRNNSTLFQSNGTYRRG